MDVAEVETTESGLSGARCSGVSGTAAAGGKEEHLGAVDSEVRGADITGCLLYTSPSPRDGLLSRMPSSA